MQREANSGSPQRLSEKYAPPLETQQLIVELYRQELMAARGMPPEEKALAGQRLFEAACRITLAGIRDQFPEASEEEGRQILRERVRYQRKLESVPSRLNARIISDKHKLPLNG